MIFEVGKNYVNTEYSGDLSACIAERDGIEWTPARIKAAFNFGNGTAADFRRYIKDNAKYAYFIEI